MLAPTEGGYIKLYKEINIESYPGWSDFNGYSKLFKDEILLVISKKGRPLSFSTKNKWELYDVYCVVYENRIYECFSHCLEALTTYDFKKIS